MRGLVALALTCLMILPSVDADFGDEGPLGYPIGADGAEIVPHVPQDWYDNNPEVRRLVDDWIATNGLRADAAQLVYEAAGGADADPAVVEPINKQAGFTVFPYYAILTAELQRLAADHPTLVRMSSIGESRLGLDIWQMEVGNFFDKNATPFDEREVVYLDGGTHSNEYSGVYFVTEWLQFLLDEYETNETARWIVENRHTFIVPMVNVDGSHAFGRVNAIDVNINRNFPATWGTVDETPVLNWPGPYPNSEPETQAITGALDRIDPDFVQSTHCCGNLWLFPYGAEQLGNAPDFDMFSKVCREVFTDLTVNVSRVQCGETWSTIYPASGTTLDEGYGRNGASSWSYEMSGRSEVPHATWGYPVVRTDVREQEIESWRGVMHGMLHAERYGAHPVLEAIDGDDEMLRVTIHNDGWGNLTEGALTVAGQAVSFGHLPTGGTRTYTFSGDFEAGQVPVEMEWKKRFHPESKWGRTLAQVELIAQGDDLIGNVTHPDPAPSMAHLLPELTEEQAQTLAEQRAAEEAFAAQDHDGDGDHDSPIFSLVALLAALGAVVVLVRRRRNA